MIDIEFDYNCIIGYVIRNTDVLNQKFNESEAALNRKDYIDSDIKEEGIVYALL